MPPRYWWLKRFAAAFVFFLLALTVTRLIWGQVAERRLQAQLARYRAAGQPVYLQDFIPPPVAAADNAAEFLRKAAAGLPSLDPDEIYYGLRHGTLGPTDARAFLDAHAEALHLLHEASIKTAVDWHIQLTSPAVSIMLPNLTPQRSLAKASCIAVRYQHVLGDDAAALAIARDMLAIGPHVDATAPGLISPLVAIAGEALLLHALEEITPGLRVAAEVPGAAEAQRPATRAQVQALVRDLLQVAPLKQRWERAMQGERAYQLDTVLWVVNAPTGMSFLAGAGAPLPAMAFGRGVGVLLAPAWKLDLLRQMQRCDEYARAATLETWVAARRHAPGDPAASTPPEGPAAIAHLFSSILSPSLEGALKQVYVLITLRRCTATALSIRLYELDHGRRPRTLAELVPDYLPAVPGDPFDPEEGPLRYLPDAVVPVLYSVGQNENDDGGVFGLRADGSVDWRARDIPFFLNGDRPCAPPSPSSGSAPMTQPSSAEALDQNGDVAGGDGDEGEHQPQPE